MVCEWSAYRPLTLTERHKIKEALVADMSYSQMAIYVGRPKSTVMREAKRLGDIRKYSPIKAHEDFLQKHDNKKRKKK